MIHGIYQFGKKRVACRNDYCTVCKTETFAEGRRSLIVVHVFFIPVIPLGRNIRWHCIRCDQETDARRPVPTGFLVAGVLLGLFFAYVGTMVLITTKEFMTSSPVIGAGLALAGSMYWLIKREDDIAYRVGNRRITPLSAERCPYCATPLLPSATPHCHSCDVRILTK